jgi:hypothetical protein
VGRTTSGSATGAWPVDVTAAESADVATAIAAQAKVTLQASTGGQQVKVPNIWVPDSSSWLPAAARRRPEPRAR